LPDSYFIPGFFKVLVHPFRFYAFLIVFSVFFFLSVFIHLPVFISRFKNAINEGEIKIKEKK